MDFLKFPFFNKTYNITSNINRKFFKNISVLTFVMLSTLFSLIYVSFIFFAGLNKFVPEALVKNEDIRNLVISILHTFSSLFAILYSSFYLDKKRYDGKIVSPAIATIVVFTFTLLLGWRCYFSGDLEILIFILTLDGVMLSVFMIFLSILQYDVVSNKTARKFVPCVAMRTLVIVALILFLFSIFTYYNYFSYFLTVIAHTNLSTFQTDALVLFSYMLANLCLLVSTILMFFIEHKLNILLKEFTQKVRHSTDTK